MVMLSMSSAEMGISWPDESPNAARSLLTIVVVPSRPLTRRSLEMSVTTKLAAMQFTYDGDYAANAEIAQRIAERAAQRKTIFYSELVRGVTFRLPNVAGGSPFQLGELGEWTDLDRR